MHLESIGSPTRIVFHGAEFKFELIYGTKASQIKCSGITNVAQLITCATERIAREHDISHQK
jgi:hypothetical protein